MIALDDIVAQLDGARRSGEGWCARCPAHDDSSPSLSIGEGDDGRILVKCHAGCDTDAIVSALGLTARDLFPSRNGNGASVEVARYVYRDPDGKKLYTKLRFAPKRFVREPKDVQSSLYGLERLQYVDDALLFVSESEKDADAVMELDADFTAVSSGGATTWREEWSDAIASARPRGVVILEHHDDAGKKFSTRVAASLSKRGLSVRVLSFEGRNGYDVCNWLRDGGDIDQLLARAESVEEWSPTERVTDDGDLLAQQYDPFEVNANEPSPWLWRGLLPRVGAAIVAQDSGGGKTWMVIESGLACATARPLFDAYPFCLEEPGDALILLEEDARANVRSRTRQLTRGRYSEGEIVQARTRLHVISHSGIQLDTEEGRGRLRQAVEKIRPRLVISDPLAEVHSRQENSAEEMLSWLKPLRTMARELGFLLLLTHHTRKGYKTQDADPKQMARGSSALKGWADSFLVAKALGNNTFAVSCKQRFGTEDEPAVEDFTLTRKHDREARSVSWDVSEGFEATVLASADALKVLQAVERNGGELLRTQLKDECRLGGKKFTEALEVLELAGKVELVDTRAPAKDGSMRKQTLVRHSAKTTSRKQPGTTGDKPGTSLVASNRGLGTTYIGMSPVEEGCIQDSRPETGQPGTTRSEDDEKLAPAGWGRT